MNGSLSVLGLIRRAGKLQWGYDTAVESVRSGACCLVLLACDLSDKTKKNMRFEANRQNVPVIETACTMDDVFVTMGKRTGIIAVCDRGFAEKLRASVPAVAEREELRI